MSGSKTNQTERESIMEAMKTPPTGGYFVWDGVDEDDRPATETELNTALASYRRKRGRPVGSTKTQITLRIDNETLTAFRAMGPGWQTRMDEALKEWITTRAA